MAALESAVSWLRDAGLSLSESRLAWLWQKALARCAGNAGPEALCADSEQWLRREAEYDVIVSLMEMGAQFIYWLPEAERFLSASARFLATDPEALAAYGRRLRERSEELRSAMYPILQRAEALVARRA